jgi:hypothetical protein
MSPSLCGADDLSLYRGPQPLPVQTAEMTYPLPLFLKEHLQLCVANAPGARGINVSCLRRRSSSYVVRVLAAAQSSGVFGATPSSQSPPPFVSPARHKCRADWTAFATRVKFCATWRFACARHGRQSGHPFRRHGAAARCFFNVGAAGGAGFVRE